MNYLFGPWRISCAQPCGTVSVSTLMIFITYAIICANRQSTWHTGIHVRAIWEEQTNMYIYIYHRYIHLYTRTLLSLRLSRSLGGGRWEDAESTGIGRSAGKCVGIKRGPRPTLDLRQIRAKLTPPRMLRSTRDPGQNLDLKKMRNRWFCDLGS